MLTGFMQSPLLLVPLKLAVGLLVSFALFCVDLKASI